MVAAAEIDDDLNRGRNVDTPEEQSSNPLLYHHKKSPH
jgi:hypothetical protein